MLLLPHIELSQELDMDMMQECHPEYDLFQTFCEPADVGHAGCARKRTYVIGAHSEKTVILEDPFEMQQRINKYIHKRAKTRPSDYLIASAAEIQLEAQERSRSRKIPYQPDSLELDYLLTDRERKAVSAFSLEYLYRTHQNIASNEDMFLFLGDNPEWGLTWSLSGRIPTYRRNSKSGVYWSPKYRRWLTNKERLASLGWPVIPEMADRMQVPCVPALDVKRAADLAGGSMHFLNTGVQQLLALICFGPVQPHLVDF